MPIPSLKRWVTQEFHCSLNHFWKRRMWPTCNGGGSHKLWVWRMVKFMTWTLGFICWKIWQSNHDINVQMFQIYFCLFTGECPKLISFKHHFWKRQHGGLTNFLVIRDRTDRIDTLSTRMSSKNLLGGEEGISQLWCFIGFWTFHGSTLPETKVYHLGPPSKVSNRLFSGANC